MASICAGSKNPTREHKLNETWKSMSKSLILDMIIINLYSVRLFHFILFICDKFCWSLSSTKRSTWLLPSIVRFKKKESDSNQSSIKTSILWIRIFFFFLRPANNMFDPIALWAAASNHRTVRVASFSSLTPKHSKLLISIKYYSF